MTVGIELGEITDELGEPDFFHAFFSTVSGNLEPRGWGSRFPMLMDKLYAGEVAQADAEPALSELNEACAGLVALPVDRLIWDIADRKATPPWGDDIADTITDLSNYFVTSTGRDLIQVLREVLEELRDSGVSARIVHY